MLRALFWKEWRVQRPLVFAALAIAGLLPAFLFVGILASATDATIGDVSDLLLPTYVVLIWPLFAVATAGNSIAADAGDGSLGILLSRPVPLSVVWLVKVATAAGALGSIVVLTAGVALTLEWAGAGAPGLRPFIEVALESMGENALAVALLITLMFGCALYCSTWVKRPLSAAIGGFLVSTAVVVPVGVTGWVLLAADRSPANGLAFRTGALAALSVAGVGMLVASFLVFAGRRFLEPGARRVRPIILVAAAAFVAATFPAHAHFSSITAGRAASNVGDLTVEAGSIILPQLTDDGSSTALVRRSMDDASVTNTLVPRGATKPVTSPSREWVVYVAYSSNPTVLAPAAHLRAVRSDGDEDHAISGPLDGWASGFANSSLRIAPDNDHVVFTSSATTDPVVASISGTSQDAITFPIRAAEDREIVRGAGVIGWTSGSSSELLYYRIVGRVRTLPSSRGTPNDWGSAMQRTEVRALDPSTLRSRRVRWFDGEQRLELWGTRVFGYGSLSSRSWSWLPVWTTGPRDNGVTLSLVDVRSGATIEVSRSPCSNWGFSTSGDRFLYAVCRRVPSEGSAPRVEVRELDLATRQDQLFAALGSFVVNSSVRSLLRAPGDDRIALFGRDGYGRGYYVYIVGRGGAMRRIDVRGFPIRWLNNAEILVIGGSGSNHLLRVNVDTGTVTRIFP